jgi:hypothetical protein
MNSLFYHNHSYKHDNKLFVSNARGELLNIDPTHLST